MPTTSQHRHRHRAPHPTRRAATPAQPRILIACGEAELSLWLAVLLGSITPHIDIVNSPERLRTALDNSCYDLVITRFVAMLLGDGVLRCGVKSEVVGAPIFVLAYLDDELGVEITLRLLEAGVAQVITLPVVAERLYNKVRRTLLGVGL